MKEPKPPAGATCRHVRFHIAGGPDIICTHKARVMRNGVPYCLVHDTWKPPAARVTAQQNANAARAKKAHHDATLRVIVAAARNVVKAQAEAWSLPGAIANLAASLADYDSIPRPRPHQKKGKACPTTATT